MNLSSHALISALAGFVLVGCANTDDAERAEEATLQAQTDDTDLEQYEAVVPLIDPATDDLPPVPALGPDGFTAEVDPQAACVDCEPVAFFAFGHNGPWQQECYQFGCAPWYTVGDNIGMCYCGETCESTANGGSVTASPTVVPVVGNTACTQIHWDVDCDSSQVWVSHNGAAETLYSQGSSGNQSACWITEGSTYDFRLYEGTAHANLLDQVHVTGVDGGNPDPCSNCPWGTCPCEPPCGGTTGIICR